MQMQKVIEQRTLYNVTISYMGHAYPKYDDRIRNMLRKDIYHSGMDLYRAIRELSFTFLTKRGAENFAARARKKLRNLKYLAGIHIYDDNGDVV
jgi:hypothetical protein